MAMSGKQQQNMSMLSRSPEREIRPLMKQSADPCKNHPSKMKIRKVEDGDSCVGNENGLLETDFQGLKEESGGLEEKYW